MEISFIHTQILVHLHVNKTDFHTKSFALGLALKQRWKAIRKSPIMFKIHLPKDDYFPKLKVTGAYFNSLQQYLLNLS